MMSGDHSPGWWETEWLIRQVDRDGDRPLVDLVSQEVAGLAEAYP